MIFTRRPGRHTANKLLYDLLKIVQPLILLKHSVIRLQALQRFDALVHLSWLQLFPAWRTGG